MISTKFSRKSLVTETKLRGRVFSSSAIDALDRYIQSNGLQDGFKEFVRLLCEKLKEAEVAGTVEPVHVQQAINSVTSLESKAHVFIISAFQVPKLRHQAALNTFEACALNPSRLSYAKEKYEAYRDRYQVLLQRSLRYDLFAKSVFETRNARAKLQISTIASLDGVGSDVTVTIMGMVYSREDGLYFMEDLNDRVQVDLSHAKYTSGFFVNGCFVIAQGSYSAGIFYVSGIGFPPAETRAQSLRSLLHQNDFFGAAAHSGTLAEEQADPSLLVTLCEVYLNQPKVVTRLRGLFATLTSLTLDPATLTFVLAGSFLDTPFNYGDGGERAKYTQSLDRLADMVASEFPDLAAKAKFVLIPGPNDPTVGGFVLPQSALPAVFTAHLRRRLTHVTLATNPCRVRFYTQEVVVFRDDCTTKHRRHCLPALPPLAAEKPNIHLVKTLVDQAHLSCVPTQVTPTLWSYDHALRLFPLPHLIMLCDPVDHWETSYMDCQVLSPGNFSTAGTFVFYYAGARRHEFQKMQS